MYRQRLSFSLLAVVTAGAYALSSVAMGESAQQSGVGAQYRAAEGGTHWPLQAMSYRFGSKRISGAFTRQQGRCLVSLVMADYGEPGTYLPVTPSRMRLLLQPRQVLGLDSEEGRSVNLTCAEDAGTMHVEVGDRGVLAAEQARTFTVDFARAP